MFIQCKDNTLINLSLAEAIIIEENNYNKKNFDVAIYTPSGRFIIETFKNKQFAEIALKNILNFLKKNSKLIDSNQYLFNIYDVI